MAMSGTVTSDSSKRLYAIFDWYVTYNLDRKKATFTVNAYLLRGTDGSFSNNFVAKVQSGTNRITFNGTEVWFGSPGGTGSQSNPVKCYTSIYSMCADKTSPVKYTSGEVANCYCWGYAHFLSNYTFETDIDDDGNTSLTIDAQFASGYSSLAGMTATIVPTQAEMFSKIGNKSGGSWNSNARIWYKSNGVWTKKFLYRKESGSWNKK